MRMRYLVLGLAVFPALACGLERLDDDGGDGGIPPAVQERFSNGCAISGCHDGSSSPNLLPGNSDAIIGQSSSAGPPLVEFGNLNSEIVRRLLLPETDPQRMPSGTPPNFDEADAAVIVGWVAGAPFDDTDGGMDTDVSTTVASTTGMDTTTGTTTTSTTDDSAGSTGDGMDTGQEPTLANVSMLLAGRCALPGCHITNAFDPDLTDEAALLATVNTESGQAAGINYITPGDSANSYLYAKIAGTQADLGGGGTPMPPPEGNFTAGELELVRAWIDNGAM